MVSPSHARMQRVGASPLILMMAVLICGAAGRTAWAAGETITVTTLNDVVDFASPQRVANLPGPDGVVSFREATTAANNTTGPQTIHFAIPTNEWWLLDGVAVLRLEDGIFILSDDETMVDFTTQTQFSGDTNPEGNEVGIYGLQANAWGIAAILISGDHCTVKGLDRVMQRGYGVDIHGNHNRVIGCTISGPLYAGVKVGGSFGAPPAQFNVVGGTEPGEGNVLSSGNDGVRVDSPADNNVVIGNVLDGRYWGATVRGSPYTPPPNFNRIGGPTPAERNIIAGAGKYGEEGFPDGGQLKVEYAHGTLVEGNYIGTTPDGMAREPQIGPVGVLVRESTDTVIRNNLISGLRIAGVNHYAGQLFGVGISIIGPTDNTAILGNLIGTDATGEGAIPTLNGISTGWFQGNPTNTFIGGPDGGEGNVVAFVERTGISIGSSTFGAWISGNSIFDNGLLGIDLLTNAGGGVTPNDPGDVDANGGNRLQNFPVLAVAESDGVSTTVTGTLNSVANQSYEIEFFASAECDPTGFGEGEFFLGSTIVSTNGDGNAAIDATMPVGLVEGDQVTATATLISAGETSEFSACVLAEITAMVGDVDGDGDVDMADFRMMFDCLDGPMEPSPVECATADLDQDSDVDLKDFSLLQNELAGGL